MKVVILANYPINNFADQLKLKKKINVSSHWNYNLINGLSKFDELDIHLISLFHDLDKDYLLKHNSVTYHFLAVSRILNMLTIYYSSLLKINRAIQKIVPDIVAGIGTEHIYAYAAVKSGYPFVITIHGIMQNVVKSDKKYIFKHRLFCRFEKRVLKKANHCISINPYVKKELNKYKNLKFYDIENCINPIFFNDLKIANKLNSTVLYIGTIALSFQQSVLQDCSSGKFTH